jgi:predicted CXXCH cytochrome family protein
MGPLRGAFLASLWFGLAAALIAGSSPQSSPGSPPQPLAAQAASPQVAAKFDVNDCKTCHEKALTSFEHTKHMKLPGLCENCHGDVTNHVKSETEKGEVGTIVSFKKMKPADVTKTCLTCHDKARQANWMGGVHDRKGLACTTCHSVHDFKSVQAQLKTTRDNETCFSCHPAIRAKGMRTSHHPVREG